jgi:hypothetical protein
MMTMAASGSITIGSAYPWGRTFDEYVAMFGLTPEDLRRRIISCADGPASLNVEQSRRGNRVVSCDPLYQFSAEEIRERIVQTREILLERAKENAHLFVWKRIGSPEELGELRRRAMREFLQDYSAGRLEGRYLDQALPRLDFADNSFDLGLCSHFLFLYSDDLSFDFHLQSIVEMCRVAREVRIFPLRNMHAEMSPHFADVLSELTRLGLKPDIETVDYEFLRGANQMLRVTRQAIL